MNRTFSRAGSYPLDSSGWSAGNLVALTINVTPRNIGLFGAAPSFIGGQVTDDIRLQTTMTPA
jgi:hypothetical protein